MKWKGPVLSGLAFLLLAVATGHAKDDPVSLLQRHRYEAAISVWDKELQQSREGIAAIRAIKGQAIAYARLGRLYESLQGFSLAIMEDYYQQLAENNLTSLVSLYLGQIEYAMGEGSKSKSWLEKAKATGNATTQEMASVYLQAISGNHSKAFKTADAEFQAVVLDPQGRASAVNTTPSTPRTRRCRLSLLSREAVPNLKALETALAEVVRDAQEPEIIQEEGKNTQINFYDPELLGTLSQGYFALAKSLNLELLAQESKFPNLAAKFKTSLALAEACLHLGSFAEALKYLNGDDSQESLLLRAQVLAKMKKAKEAESILEKMTAQAGRNASLKRDIAEAYYLCELNPDKGLQLIEQALHDRNGPNYYMVQGGLLLAKGKGDAAVQQLAKGYKIEFRNRIDQIDPEYMSQYSFALYRNNKLRYEEIVETLYHLQKEFPPCRQMHYCMQGVSASLARSYEAQRIFRKGG